ncbi:MAG: periplasmic heavy metal sensor [Gemmataceae bacterium]
MPCTHWAWRRARHGIPQCGVWEGRGHGGRPWGGPEGDESEGGGGGGFGIRRPLRFLSHRLGLDQNQTATLAGILDNLKIERAQADVDRRRTVAALAEALTGDPFDAAKATAAADAGTQSTQRLQTAVVHALQQIHALLTPEQRGAMAYLIRTGKLLV